MDEAEKLALSIIEEFPEYPFCWKVLAAILGQTSRKSETLGASLRSIVLSPRDAEFHNNLGLSLQELGRLDKAEASYMHAIALKADYAQAHNNFDNTLENLGILDGAEASYAQSVALKPNFEDALVNRWQLLLAKNNSIPH